MIAQFFISIWRWIVRWLRPVPAPIALQYVEGDDLPGRFSERTLVVARDHGELWVAGMICPCGCGRRVELMLLRGVKPRWDLIVGGDGLPTLHPSVWVKDGCRSHFWLRRGQIQWCD